MLDAVFKPDGRFIGLVLREGNAVGERSPYRQGADVERRQVSSGNTVKGAWQFAGVLRTHYERSRA